MIVLFKVSMAEDVPEKVGEVLTSGFVGQGSKVEDFEEVLRGHFGNPYVNTVNSCTSGLHLALHLAKGDGGDVLTTPLTCTATNFPIVANGLNLRWIDIDPTTCNIDYEDLERKVGPKTKAIMVVHWSGYACDLDRLRAIQRRCRDNWGNEPPIIEDCAHSWGAKYKNKLLGNHGNTCVFSFQAIKHMTTVDGGVIVSPSDNYHRKVKLLRWYGLDRTSRADFRCEQNIEDWGFKFHMNDVNAQIGLCNYPNSKAVVERHNENGEFYNRELKGVPGVTLLNYESDRYPSYWIYTMRVENRSGFARKMSESGIMVSQVHDRNDKHSCLYQYRSILPGLDKISKEMICIPCGWWVTDEDRQYIVDTIKKGW